MLDHDHSSEAVFEINLHIVLVTKNRQSIFSGPIKRKLRDVIREICDDQQVEILSGNISNDHVHLLISISPKININKFILLLKGKTTYSLFTTYTELKDRYYNRHLWAKGCFCLSCGDVTDEKIQSYIEKQNTVEKAQPVAIAPEARDEEPPEEEAEPNPIEDSEAPW